MRKFTIHPLVFISTIIVSLGGGLYLGDSLSGQLSLPGLKRTSQLDFSSLNDVYGLLQRNFDGSTDDTKALEGAKAGLVASVGDPYTTYLTATEADKITNDLAGKLSGIGAEIGLKNNTITVIAPIADAPAEKAGLKAGDYIVKVNDEDTTGMTVDSAVSKIRGAKGTTVKLNLARSGTDAFDVTITRDDITVPSVKSELKNGNVAYIRLTQFGPDSATQVRTAATNLKSQGATKIILDLRNNPGGYLDTSVGVASQFLAKDLLVVEERTGGKTTDKLKTSGNPVVAGLPTIVLINNGSASASEIVAAALKDHGAAKLVGEQSFGKGSVQTMKPLPDGAQLKVTIAHWYTPAGINISKEGVKPDVEIKQSTEDYNAGRDPVLDKALELLK